MKRERERELSQKKIERERERELSQKKIERERETLSKRVY